MTLKCKNQQQFHYEKKNNNITTNRIHSHSEKKIQIKCTKQSQFKSNQSTGRHNRRTLVSMQSQN